MEFFDEWLLRGQDHQQGEASSVIPRSPADPMDVGFYVIGAIILYDPIDLRKVEAPRGDVSCKQSRCSLLSEGEKDRCAFFLLLSPM